MFEVTFFSAFIGGLLTFFAPCTLPLIPAFVAFISGQAPADGEPIRVFPSRIFVSALLFVSGFTLVFMLFGLASGVLGTFLTMHRRTASAVGGILVILFGLGMLGVIKIPRLEFYSRLHLPSFIHVGTNSGGFLLGALFALGWSPCLGPVLGTILVLAGMSSSAYYGTMLLFVYAMGLAVPFLLVALIFGKSVTYVSHIVRYLPLASRIGAVFVIIIGILLLVGEFGLLNSLVVDIYALPLFQPLVDRM